MNNLAKLLAYVAVEMHKLDQESSSFRSDLFDMMWGLNDKHSLDLTDQEVMEALDFVVYEAC